MAHLTLYSTVAIATGNWKTPLRASSLIPKYGTAGKPLSLLAVRDKLESRKNIYIFQVRNSSLLEGNPSYATIQQRWASLNPAYVPTQAQLAYFVTFLKKYGVSVVKISPDWRTVAVTGTTSAIANTPTIYAEVAQATSSPAGAGIPPPTPAGGGLVIGGLGTAGAGGAVLYTGTTTWGAAAGGTTTALGSTALGTLGAGASAETALAGSAFTGPVGVGLVLLGIGLTALGVYLWSDSPSNSGTSSSTSGQTSQNDPTSGYQAGDGTEVYGASSDTDATAIASAAAPLPPVDPSSIPSEPPSEPIASNEGGGSGDGGGSGSGTITTCPITGIPLTPPGCPAGPGGPGPTIGCIGCSGGFG